LESLPKYLAASGAVEMQTKLGSISGGKILDIATGTGDFINTLMKTLKNYDSFVGIDISAKDLESAKKRFKDQPVEFLEMNAESLEFKENSFDTVSMAYTLHHLSRIDKVLAEMKRVLKPGGNLIIQEEFSDGSLTEAQKTNLLQHTWDAEIDTALGKTHKATLARHKFTEPISNLQLERVEILESTHPVKCLSCEKRYNCEDPKEEGNIQDQIKEIDDNLKRLQGIADPETRRRLQDKGEELKKRNREFGNANLSTLLVIGRKC
jgi:2-polyprenyl-3-methyl-5-hydroxy-6-metoxy-1,4-benzoquinol methylase